MCYGYQICVRTLATSRVVKETMTSLTFSSACRVQSPG